MKLPGVEQALPCGQETISTTEAMHEDIYFSILEYFQHYSGREPGHRGLQPGQIIPAIRLDNQDSPQVSVTLAPATPAHLAAPHLMPVDKKHQPQNGKASGEE